MMNDDEPRVWIRRRALKGGRSSYDLRWIDDCGKTRSKAAGRDRKAAAYEAARLEAALVDGTHQDTTTIAWQAFVDDHVAKISGDANRVEAKYALEEFGTMMSPRSPKHVSYGMVESFVAKLRTADDSEKAANTPATVNKKLRYLRAALNRAIKRGYAGRNPVGVELFLPTENKAPRIATDAEERQILKAAKSLYGFKMWALVSVALRTGGRRSELIGLTWDRIDLEGDNPRVHFTRTKGHKDRYVPLSSGTVKALRRLKIQTLRDGGPFVGLSENLGRRWKRILRVAEVSGLSFHDLRRTCATRLVRAGVGITTVQGLLGHSSIVTTQAYYVWTNDADLRAGIEKLAKATA